MKKLFLHIGFYKTGSTTIQRNLVENADLLRERGVFYPYRPKSAYTQRWQHAPLAAAIPGHKMSWLKPWKRKGVDRAWDAVFAHIEAEKTCQTVVLSSEAFCALNMTPQKVAWLRDKLSEFDVTVVAYIRRQDAYFLSIYQELVKSGGTKPFDFDAHCDQGRLNFAARLAPWREVFGADRVRVRPFHPQQWPEGELFFDFLQVLGVDPKGMAVVPPSNEGLDYRAVEMLRQLNMLNNTQHPGGRRKPGWRQLHHRHHKLASQLSRIFSEGAGVQKLALSFEQAETLRTHFRQDNIAALEGSGLSVDAFFPPARPDQQARIMPPEIASGLLLPLISDLARGKPTKSKPNKAPSAQNKPKQSA